MSYSDFIASVNAEAKRQCEKKKQQTGDTTLKPLVFGEGRHMRQCFEDGWDAATTIEELLRD